MKKTLIAAAVLAALNSATVAALGLGPITVRSGLGEPLNAEIAVISSDPNELDAATFRGGKIDAYKKDGMVYAPALAGLQIKLDVSKPKAPKLRLTTVKPMSDLGFHIIVDGNSNSGGYTRAYAVILQPTGEMFGRGGSAGAEVVAAAPAPAVRPLQVVEPKIPKYDRVMPDSMVADASAASAPAQQVNQLSQLSEADRVAAHAQAVAMEAPPAPLASPTPAEVMVQADEERAAARRAALDRAAEESRAAQATEATRLAVSLEAQQTEEAGHLRTDVAGIAAAHVPNPAAQNMPLDMASSTMHFVPNAGEPQKIEEAQTTALATPEPVITIVASEPAPVIAAPVVMVETTLVATPPPAPAAAPEVQTAVPVLPEIVAVSSSTAAPAPAAAAKDMRHVTLVGATPAKITLVAGKERTQPLGAALRAITPAGWSGHFDPNDAALRGALGKPVTWAGGQLWTIALNDVMQQSGLYATVNWTKKELGLASGAGAQPAPSTTPSNAAGPTAPVVLARVVQKNGAPASAAKVSGPTRSQPLGAALRAITPKGWSGYFDTQDAALRAAIGKTVTWTGGKPWPEILNGLMEQADLTAELDWKKLELALKRYQAPVTVAAPVVVAVATETAPAVTPSADSGAAERATAEQEAAKAAQEAADKTAAEANAKAIADQAARETAEKAAAEEAAAAKAAAEEAAAKTAAAERAAAEQAAAEKAAAEAAARVAAEQAEAQRLAEQAAAQAAADAAAAAERARAEAAQQAAEAARREQVAAAERAAAEETLRQEAARKEAARVAAANAVPPAATLPPFHNLLTTGTPPATIEAAQGGVANLALQPALQRLVPPGWKLFVRTGTTAGTLPTTFSWTGGGKPWLVVMDQALGNAGMVAYVDFTRKEVSLARR